MIRRWWARTCVRAAALLALLWGSVSGLSSGGGGSGDINALMSQLTGQGSSGYGPLIVGMGLQVLVPLGLAATLIWFERRIVRWLVPIPTHRCPRCDYSLIGVHDPRCPECGLPLDEGVIGKEGADDDAPTPLAAANQRRRETRRPDPE